MYPWYVSQALEIWNKNSCSSKKYSKKKKNSSRKTQLYRQFHTDYFIVLKKNHNSGGWEKLSLFTFQSSLAINPVRKSEGGPKASQSMAFLSLSRQAFVQRRLGSSHRSGGDRWVWILIGWKLQFAENVFIVFCNQRKEEGASTEMNVGPPKTSFCPPLRFMIWVCRENTSEKVMSSALRKIF